MFDKLIGFIAPHYCYSCGQSGHTLCQSCIYDITSDFQNRCFGCNLPSTSGVCPACQPRLPFANAYALGERKNELELMLNDFKFKRTYQIHQTLGQLLDASLPGLPKDMAVVPLPTIAKHIRIRGYDHAGLIARAFAARRKLKIARLLRRQGSSVQLGANAHQRRQQAESAYQCVGQLNPDIPYLLIDDIATTGASLIAAARCLKQSGAKTVIAAVIARQTLENS